jgi:hypothetical protein
MKLHPKTGLHYIVSFHSRGKAFFDIMKCYGVFAATHEWLTVITHRELRARMLEICADERYFVVLWGVETPTPPVTRKATFARVYSEAVDADPANMLDVHVKWLAVTKEQISTAMDGTFGHTPWMAEQFDGHVLPIGWEPGAMGSPQRDAPKPYRYTYFGVMVGKREWLCPAMADALGEQYLDASGEYRRVLNILNSSSGYLYLTHSDVRSFSTPRIWQAVATSAAMVTERGRDCWPMEEDHYVALPTLTQKNILEVAGFLRDLSDEYLAAMSVRLHESLKHFTIDHIVNEYLVPGSVAIQESR